MTMLAESVDLVVGVDTHKHTNTAAVVRAAAGGVLDQITVPTTRTGHQALLDLARSHGQNRAWAIEGTSSYGAGLTRFLRTQG
jgi:transposase